MVKTIKYQFEQHPLRTVLLLALLVRLIAVFFAKGYMMHDDHFLTIEPSSSWAAGKNFNDWLPGIGNNRQEPEPISFFYLGILFCLFKIYHWLGLDNPDVQMYLMRLIHAFYSLLTVYFGYKIALRLDGKKSALTVGLLLSCIAVLPNFSVRNLVELVCIPPLIIGYYLLIKGMKPNEHSPKANYFNFSISNRYLLSAAFIMGLAVGVRYQTGLLVAMVGFVLFLRVGFRSAFIFGALSFFAFFLTQIDDVLLWGGRPFQHLQGYFAYNKEHANAYPGSAFAYLSFVAYFILPPVSLMLFTGFVREWKKYLLITLPVSAFIIFHILYPNKQERFLLPALPFVVIVGVIGWNKWVAGSAFWIQRQRLQQSLWSSFWIVNTIVMLVFATTYSKRARVESMLYLYNQGDCKNFVLEFSDSESGAMMPQYYSGIWTSYYYWNNKAVPAEVIQQMEDADRSSVQSLMPRPVPNYYLFYDGPQLAARIAEIKKFYPELHLVSKIEPGWFDVVLNKLNPKNTLEKVYIYKVNG